MEGESEYVGIVSILLAVLLVTTAGQNDLEVSLELNINSPPEPLTCGDDVESSVVVAQYRLTRTSELTEWRTLMQINLSKGFSGTLLCNTTTAVTDSAYVQPFNRIQFRLLQEQHGGWGCNCWQVNEAKATMRYYENKVAAMNDSMFFSELCFDRLGSSELGFDTSFEFGLDTSSEQLCLNTSNDSMFCSGSANTARGLISGAFNFVHHTNPSLVVCPRGSYQTLISMEQRFSLFNSTLM